MTDKRGASSLIPPPSSLNESYDAFAYAYDKALGERFFRAASEMLTDALSRFPTAEKTHLDVCCGTGMALRYFRERGYRSTGLDLSLPMLELARKRASALVAADVRALPFRRTFARITCLYDSLNHMKEADDLIAAFRAVAGVMNEESLFLFDMNHPDIYPVIWGMKEPYVSHGRDYHLEIATKYRKRDHLATGRVTGWARVGGREVPIEEKHEQRAWSVEAIHTALGAAGLKAREVIDFDPFREGQRVKLFFIAEQQNASGR